MQTITGSQVRALLDYPSLVQALHRGFAADFVAPARSLYALSAQSHDAFALLPAWNDRYISVKAFTYLPDNPQQGMPMLHSQLMLFAKTTGAPLALIDGVAITCARTAAVSALAAWHLARPDTESLLLLGTGNLALPLLSAHLAVRPLKKISLWGRNRQKTLQLLQQANAQLLPRYPGLQICLAENLSQAQQQHDMIVAATAAAEPLLFGDLIPAGTHVDLLGNHNVDRRECDSGLVQKSRVFVDDRQNVLKEAGELLFPIAEGCFCATQIQGDLAALCRNGEVPQRAEADTTIWPQARRLESDITLFKSVGTALSDLLAAALVFERCQQTSGVNP